VLNADNKSPIVMGTTNPLVEESLKDEKNGKPVEASTMLY